MEEKELVEYLSTSLLPLERLLLPVSMASTKQDSLGPRAAVETAGSVAGDVLGGLVRHLLGVLSQQWVWGHPEVACCAVCHFENHSSPHFQSICCYCGAFECLPTVQSEIYRFHESSHFESDCCVSTVIDVEIRLHRALEERLRQCLMRLEVQVQFGGWMLL